MFAGFDFTKKNVNSVTSPRGDVFEPNGSKPAGNSLSSCILDLIRFRGRWGADVGAFIDGALAVRTRRLGIPWWRIQLDWTGTNDVFALHPPPFPTCECSASRWRNHRLSHRGGNHTPARAGFARMKGARGWKVIQTSQDQ